jgi:signal transduction histidine kinase
VTSQWEHAKRWLRDGAALPFLVGLLILVISVGFWWMLSHQEEQFIEDRVDAQSSIIASHVSSEINSHFRTLDRMANRWEYQGRPSYQRWHTDAMLNLIDFQGFRSILWMNNDYQVEWAVPGDQTSIARAFDHMAVPERVDAILHARETARPIVTSPVLLASGEPGFVVYRPVFVNDDRAQFDGYIVGTFATSDLFLSVTRHRAFNGYEIEILNQDEQVFQTPDADSGPDSRWTVEHRMSLAGRPWQVNVWPDEEEVARLGSNLPTFALVVGSAAAVLCSLLVLLTQTARRKTAEAHTFGEELDRMVKALEVSNRELEEFAYVASHDLKAPLVSLRGMADILSEDYRDELPDDARMYIDRITFNAGKMQHLLDDLLKMSRLRTTDTPLTSINLNDVVAGITRQLQQELTSRQAEVRIAGTLPTIPGNQMWIHQAFLNLIDNALKYVPADRQPRIEIWSQPRDGGCEVFVRDNGNGIPEEYHDRVFSMFQRLPDSKMVNPGGSGIGLAIVARVAELHHGSVSIDTTNQAGTTFVLAFPEATLCVTPDERVRVSASGAQPVPELAGE